VETSAATLCRSTVCSLVGVLAMVVARLVNLVWFSCRGNVLKTHLGERRAQNCLSTSAAWPLNFTKRSVPNRTKHKGVVRVEEAWVTMWTT
jgi:hypothetical protein